MLNQSSSKWTWLMAAIMNATAAENFLFLVIIINSIYSLIHVYNPDPQYVHQIKTFEDLEISVKTVHCNSSNDENLALPICPIDKDRLDFYDSYKLDRWLSFNHVDVGGRFRPVGCRPRQKIAIVIPYRNRQEQLDRFLLYIHQILPDQLIEYSVYVIEQNDHLPFNRAKLFNVGFGEIVKIDPHICCFIFHDVDLLPLDQRNLYMCSEKPRHLSPAVSTLRFKLLYPTMFGGVIAMTTEHFKIIGGLSNDFFGWGGEDDDTFARVRAAGLDIERTPKQYGLYTMLKHPKMQPNPLRYQLLEEFEQNAHKNGHKLVSKQNTTYKLVGIYQERLFTRILVNL